eukprot:GGOE01004093.1.p3 GENE.GGOE01004093.1~~GGOE01004093.1.p3  ORF type:complete len:106 (-),score=5.51 GGOE01004093.1:4-321(-)
MQGPPRPMARPADPMEGAGGLLPWHAGIDCRASMLLPRGNPHAASPPETFSLSPTSLAVPQHTSTSVLRVPLVPALQEQGDSSALARSVGQSFGTCTILSSAWFC